MKQASFFICIILISVTTLMASPYPSGGTLFKQYQNDSFEKPPHDKKQSEPIQIKTQPVDYVEDNSSRLLVISYEIHGNTRLSKDVIEQTLIPYTNVHLSTTGIHKAANALRQAYVNNGYFAAEVLVPPQAITANVVAFHVYEGVLAADGVQTINSGECISDSHIHNILYSNLRFGEVMKTDEFERTILLIGDLPGISIRTTIYPGKEPGTANFLLETQDTSLYSGNIYIDNFGNYYTGEERLGVNLNINSPSRTGDILSIGAVTSGEDSTYGYMTYEWPVGGNGARIGIRGDYLKYNLGKELESQNANGDATEIRLLAKYPFVRSRHTNAQGQIDLVYLNLNDHNNVIGSAKRDITSLVLNLQGDHDDDYWAAGEFHYSTGLTLGDVSIDGGDLYKTFDEQNSKIEGSFLKFAFYVSRLQHISGPLSTFVSLGGQIANKNLDTSQKYFIGGPYSVAGYPIGEMSGDDAALLYTDLRYDFFDVPWGGNTQLSIFYSQGWAKLHHDTWSGWQGTNTQIENDMTLKSVGISAHQTWKDQFVLQTILGRQLGNNIGSDPLTGEDSDRSTSEYRFWIQGIYYF